MLDAFKRIMVIAPHCDDETYGCGGLLSRFTKDGAAIRVIVVACADAVFHHHLGREVGTTERYAEFSEAMATLGVESHEVLFPFTDATTVGLRKIIGRLDSEIRNFHPTCLLYPTMSHHQDHIIAHQASEAALRPSKATLDISFTGMYEYLMSQVPSDRAMVFVDIGEGGVNRKVSALRCYKSQVRGDDHPDCPENIKLFAKFRGRMAGMEFAEVIYPVRVSV